MYDQDLLNEYKATVLRATYVFLSKIKDDIEQSGSIATAEELLQELETIIKNNDRNI